MHSRHSHKHIRRKDFTAQNMQGNSASGSSDSDSQRNSNQPEKNALHVDSETFLLPCSANAGKHSEVTNLFGKTHGECVVDQDDRNTHNHKQCHSHQSEKRCDRRTRIPGIRKDAKQIFVVFLDLGKSVFPNHVLNLEIRSVIAFFQRNKCHGVLNRCRLLRSLNRLLHSLSRLLRSLSRLLCSLNRLYRSLSILLRSPGSCTCYQGSHIRSPKDFIIAGCQISV